MTDDLPRLNDTMFSDVIDVNTEQVKNYINIIPAGARKMLGCSSCEWKGTQECPVKSKEPYPAFGICPKRAYFLASFTSGKKVSLPDFMKTYNSVVGQEMNMKHRILWAKLNEDYLQKKAVFDQMSPTMNKSTRDDEAKNLARLKAEADSLWDKWFKLWDKNMTYAERSLDRDSREDTAREMSTMSLTDINRLMRGEIVDVKPN